MRVCAWFARGVCDVCDVMSGVGLGGFCAGYGVNGWVGKGMEGVLLQSSTLHVYGGLGRRRDGI